MTKRIETIGIPFTTEVARKTTSGETIIKDGKGILERIIIGNCGQRCVVAVKDGDDTKMLFMLSGKTPYEIPCAFNFKESLKSEMFILDPIQLFNFNNKDDIKVAEDLSGMEVHGDIKNMSDDDRTEDSVRGKALIFNGVDEYITCENTPFDFHPDKPFSVSMWIKNRSTSGGDCLISKMGNYTPPGWVLNVDKHGQILMYILGANSTAFYTICQQNVPFDTWTHVVVAYDGNNNAEGLNYYINSDLAPKTIPINTLNTSTSNNKLFTVGALDEGGTSHFTGTLDELMMFDRLLSPIEIEYIFRNGYGYESVDGARLGDITFIYE